MKDFSKEDRAQRERLERQSPSGARVDMAGRLNALAAGRGNRELPGVSAYLLLQGMQARGRAVAKTNAKHDRLAASGRLDTLDRIHPGSPLRRAATKTKPPSGGSVSPDRIDLRAFVANQLRARYW